MTWRAQTRYRAAIDAGQWPVEQWERLSPVQVAGERIVLGLRLAEGVPLAWLTAHFEGRPDRLAERLERHTEAGLLAVKAERVRLTDRGVLLSDSVFADLL
jgi:oxygen-independent coproporphyrinogen-3 oxidase